MALIWDSSHRDGQAAANAAAEDRFLMERAGVSRKERLAAWRGWAANKLAAEFVLPADEGARGKMIGQCTAELERMVRQLFDRGWLIEGKRLGEVVGQCIAPIAAAQRAGKIGDFFPYFRHVCKTFVGVHAEDLQRVARRDGADAAQAFSGGLAIALGMLRDGPKVESLTEVIGESLAERRQEACKPSAGRRGRPRKDTGAGTGDLFGGGD